MNEKAKAVGTVNSNFNNPHGLNDQTHLTTAYDMAKILWAAAENDTYRKIAGTESYQFTDGAGKTISCSHGYKVFNKESPHYDVRCVCGKTGYTSEAMFTRAVYATDGELDLIAVTMHSDSTALAYQDIRTLLDYGFKNFSLLDFPEYDAKDFVLTAASGRQIELTAGEMIESFPGKYLVPNSYASVSWKPQLTSDEGSLIAKYVYGNDLITVSYPVWVDDPEAPTETEGPTLPDSAGKTTQAGTKESGAVTSSTEDPLSGDRDGLSTRQVIVICILTALLAVSLYILVEMFLAVKKHGKKRSKR